MPVHPVNPVNPKTLTLTLALALSLSPSLAFSPIRSCSVAISSPTSADWRRTCERRSSTECEEAASLIVDSSALIVSLSASVESTPRVPLKELTWVRVKG